MMIDLLGLALNVTTEVYIDEKVTRAVTTGITTHPNHPLIRAPLNPRAPHNQPPGDPIRPHMWLIMFYMIIYTVKKDNAFTHYPYFYIIIKKNFN